MKYKGYELNQISDKVIITLNEIKVLEVSFDHNITESEFHSLVDTYLLLNRVKEVILNMFSEFKIGITKIFRTINSITLYDVLTHCDESAFRKFIQFNANCNQCTYKNACKNSNKCADGIINKNSINISEVQKLSLYDLAYWMYEHEFNCSFCAKRNTFGKTVLLHKCEDRCVDGYILMLNMPLITIMNTKDTLNILSIFEED